MSEVYHQESGEWNQPGNQSSFTEVANESPKEQVKGGSSNMFGAEATKPSAESGGHGQLVRPVETVPTADGHDDGHEGKPAMPKKANPFV